MKIGEQKPKVLTPSVSAFAANVLIQVRRTHSVPTSVVYELYKHYCATKLIENRIATVVSNRELGRQLFMLGFEKGARPLKGSDYNRRVQCYLKTDVTLEYKRILNPMLERIRETQHAEKELNDAIDKYGDI